MRLTLITSIILAIGIGTSSNANASLIFQFEKSSDGAILALMELNDTDLSFDHTDILSFNFTSTGDAIFGLGTANLAALFNRTDLGFTTTPSGDRLTSIQDPFLSEVLALGNFTGGPENDFIDLQTGPTGFSSFITQGVDGIQQPGSGAGFWVASAVPIPPALWLFGSGLIGLVGFARRKQK